jgi:hypothetical protein
VVNRIFDGAGWLAARFTQDVLADQGALRERLSHWLRIVSGPAEPVDVVISGHCNDLQAHARLTERVLHWPGEPLTTSPEHTVEATDLRLRHNARTDLLELTDARGRLLNLIYLGSTFPSPIWGLRYALMILTQPYLVSRPSFEPPADRCGHDVFFEPRLTHGNIVLRRATWWVATDYLEREWFRLPEAQGILRAKRDCIRYGIPERVFAQRYIVPERNALIPSDVLKASRKPIWIDLRNPFWLAMLERTAGEGAWVLLTEPLPGPEELWLKIDGKPHVSELQIEMIARSDPHEAGPSYGVPAARIT